MNYKRFIRIFWGIYISIFIFIFVLFYMISAGLLGFMPSFEELENPRSYLASEVYSADQVLLGKYFIENRSNVHYEDLSPNIVNALVATEDERFYEHSGVDVKAIIRAAFGVVTSDNKGGGSTVTQQLAKNLFPRDKNPSFLDLISVKLREWVTAIKLERRYTKNEILAMYLNTVDFGSQSFGIESASKTFFKKKPSELDIEEAALLVGLLKAPTYYSPVKNPKNALNRRNVVLTQMYKYNYISKNTLDSLKALPIDLSNYRIHDHNTGLATYFREYLRLYLLEWCKNNKKPDGTYYNIYKDGLKIYTTIDSRMQRYAEEAVSEHLGKKLQPEFFKHWKGIKRAPFSYDIAEWDIKKIMNSAMRRSDRYIYLKSINTDEKEIEKIFNTPVEMSIFTWNGNKDTVMSPMDSIRYYKHFLHTGFMSMDPRTGFVKAWVGGINYNYFKYDHVMVSKRQVGSTFKPFIYTIAVRDKGYTPCTAIPNVPVSIEMGDGTFWEPKTAGYEDLIGEMVPLKEALAKSLNYVSARLIQQSNPAAVVKLARKMGIKSDLPAVYSLCLGSVELSVFEMVGAMSTFANNGLYTEPIYLTRLEDKMGNVIQTFAPKTEEAMNEQTAWTMIGMMRGVVEAGTGGRLRSVYKLTNPIAGKTGTTNNNSDGWFIGLTPDLVNGVWVGCEDRAAHFRTTDLGQGASMALPIWGLYMQKVYADKSLNISQGEFIKPRKASDVQFDCSGSGKKHKDDDIFKDGF